MTQRSEEIRQKAREAFDKFWESTNNSMFFRGRVISVADLKNVALEAWNASAAFVESLSGEAADSAWLIERARLCLGICDHRLAWVTFTNENAIRFSRRSDAYGMLEVLKWEPFKLFDQMQGAIVTEHSWGAAPPAASPQPSDHPEINVDDFNSPEEYVAALRATSGSGTPAKTFFHRPDKALHGTCKCADCAISKRELAAAVAAEREECAKLAQAEANFQTVEGIVASNIVTAIRSRASQPAPSQPVLDDPCENCRWHQCAGKSGGCGCRCHNPENRS